MEEKEKVSRTVDQCLARFIYDISQQRKECQQPRTILLSACNFVGMS